MKSSNKNYIKLTETVAQTPKGRLRNLFMKWYKMVTINK